MLLGLGAHYRVEVALQRALAELTQSLREDTEAPEGHWWHTVRQANPAYLYPDPTQPMRRPTDFIDQSTAPFHSLSALRSVAHWLITIE